MRFWVGVSAAFSAGTLIGIALGTILVEEKLKKEYKESTAAMRRAFEAARIDAETPALTEEELDEPLFLIQHDKDGVSLEGGAVKAVERYAGSTLTKEETDHNPYHRPVSETSPQIYASYAELEEEDYFDEEDGHAKEQITMIYDNGTPRFFMSGEEIEDAFERVGGTIVDDMRDAVRQGNATIYVRNNQTGTDYEVIFEQP